MATDLFLSTEVFTLSNPQPIFDKSSHEPCVVLDEQHCLWLAWSQRSSSGDAIFLSTRKETPIQISAFKGIEMQPSLVAIENTLWIFWVAFRDNCWKLLSRQVSNGILSEEECLFENPEGIFHPQAILDAKKNIWIVFESVQANQTKLKGLKKDTNNWEPLVIHTPSGNIFRPAISLRNNSEVWIAYDLYSEENYKVYLQRIDVQHAALLVADNGFQNVQCALTTDKDERLWLAWATNQNEAFPNKWWLTKYVQVACFDGEQLLTPIGEMPQKDLYNEDSFQGWEFPTITSDEENRIWIFGQASHTLYAQYYDANGWSERFTIAPKHWGSWKPRMQVCGKNPLYLVGMGLQGAQIQQLHLKSSNKTLFSLPLTKKSFSKPAITMARKSQKRPSLQTNLGEELYYYFGDLHAHSIHGDAMNDVDEIYHRYRDAYQYDFATLTEHDYLDGIQLSQSELKMMWNHADRMTQEDVFVALYGYEWTSPAIAAHVSEGATVGEGHRQILFPTQNNPLISYGEPSANTGKKLFQRLQNEQVEALVIPHHTGWSGTDWDAHDDARQRLVEICSTHGRFEYGGNKPIGYRRDHIHPDKFVHDGLKRGYQLGFVGGSDSHGLRWHATELEGRAKHIEAGTKVGWKEDAFRTGMTVVLAPALNRKALYEALYQRQCYATSGVKIVLDFRVNKALMGTSITTEVQPEITLSVEGTAPIRAVEIIRSGNNFSGVQSMPGEGMYHIQLSFKDTLLIPGEKQYYYARITQEDGNMAWSSPIWVTYQP